MLKLAIIITLGTFTLMTAVLINYSVTYEDVREPINYCQQDTLFYCYTQE
jgi:hypothetical protein